MAGQEGAVYPRVHMPSCTQFGDTPLHDAAREGHIALVRPLVDAGASPMAHNEVAQPLSTTTDCCIV